MATASDALREIKSIKDISKELNSVSPLALSQTLINYEIADMKSSLAILDEVYKEFECDENVLARFAEPITMAVVDTGIRCVGAKSVSNKNKTAKRTTGGVGEDAQKKYGLSAQRIWREIKAFRYEDHRGVEYNFRPSAAHYSMKDQTYVRGVLDDNQTKKQRDDYKERHFDGKITASDEYNPDVKLRGEQQRARNDKRINEENETKHMAETDHIVPLKQFHDWTDSLSKQLSDNDKKRIANLEENLAVTSKNINASKGEDSNETYAGKNEVSERQREEMLGKQKQAEKDLKGKIAKTAMTNASLREIIPVIIVPLGYEIYDMTTNGFCHGLDTDSPLEAMIIRVKRACHYIWQRVPDMLNNVLHSVVDLVATMIANLFKKFKRVIVEGFGLFVEALRILAQPSDKVTASQKWDAISKLIVGPVAALLTDLAVDTLLKKFGVPFPFSEVLSAVVAAITSTGLLFLLEKFDLFSTKSEKRLARVQEIFDQRIQMVKESTRNFDIASHEFLKSQRIKFELLKDQLNSALEAKDMNALNGTIDKVAEFFKVDIPYKSTSEFMQFISNNERIVIST